jgi:DNA (cytosine-5)-methyltransferase 1
MWLALVSKRKDVKLKIASFFSGAGGLDLGFTKEGFDVVWANEFDKKVTPTLKSNFSHAIVDDRSITEVSAEDLPDVDGIIGGPPCQSWSEAGSKRGFEDARGQVFLDYIRLIKAKKPKFFLAENVAGMLSSTHKAAFDHLVSEMTDSDYAFEFRLLNAADFGVPEDRKRVIFVGYHKDLKTEFLFPQPLESRQTLRQAIWDLKDSAMPAESGHSNDPATLALSNHEYMTGGFSPLYMSRNRVRGWDELSFTIQAGARHAPIHPNAPKMVKIGTDKFEFAEPAPHIYRRLSVREAARIQTFPDSFEFVYTDVAQGYKMVGNAVPVNLARHLAAQIKLDLSAHVAPQ